ncbi:putative protein 21 [Colletotrichum spaethianum]|uniref:Uncharacterized protein n=1 Tax=Colletotrichum spaethianum TaxID=700344 RepID=A0AA37L938_9PEZI|nr:putative protein 21 [Colletotrichum spaethianum]GKT44098.1 putative protein 21 [Colletotrichum spaethianum]
MASNPTFYTYASPREGYEDAPPLPDDLNEDGKSFKNPPREGLSKAYEAFPAPLDNGRRGGLFVTSQLSQRKPGY